MSFLLSIIRAIIINMLHLLSFGKKTISHTLSIYIKTNTGNTLTLSLNPKWNIKNVKELVAGQLGLMPNELKIIFAGKELCDSTIIEECDLGQQSILHAVKTINKSQCNNKLTCIENSLIEEPSEEASKPLCETLVDLEIHKSERENLSDEDKAKIKAHFFVYCSQCHKLTTGKLRIRCSICKGGAFTVHRDPECWDDVLKPRRIPGHCESNQNACVDNEKGDLPFAEFYFKCAEHTSGGEKDFSVPLNLIKANFQRVPCLACTDICNDVLVFPCAAKHVTCIDCFRHYCSSRLMERQFISHEDIGYTLSCPIGCENSFIQEIHHFKLLSDEQYERYQRFATEEYVLKSNGVLCPQPGCGMGLIVESNCRRIHCQNGCGYVFCRNCLQGYHIGDCFIEAPNTPEQIIEYNIDPNRAEEARWIEASQKTIKVLTKPCPKCRTPTERDGGCMHMVCTRSGCDYEWCWICQIGWTHECMGAHWFG